MVMNNNMIVVWDLETTEIIDRNRVAIADMQVSVGCALIMDFELALSSPEHAFDKAERRSYWHADAIATNPSWRPLSELAELLASARLNVAFNGKGFDMLVMKKYFGNNMTAFATAARKLYDPLEHIESQFGRFTLATLLTCNDITGKSGKGADAPVLWHEGKWDKLEEYCAVDVDRLSQLILKQTLKLPLMAARVPLGTLYGLAEENNRLMLQSA